MPSFQTWPRPTGAAPPIVLQVAAVAGLAAAVLLPSGRPGLGWFLLALVLTASARTMAQRAGPTPSRRGTPRPDTAGERTAGERPAGDRWARAACALAAVALLGIGTVHASEWLFALCVLAACAAGSLAVAGGRSVRGLALGAVAVPIAAVRAIPWVGRSAAALRRERDGHAVRFVGSVLVSVALLAVFAPLLAGADAAFARIISDALPTVDGSAVFRWIFLFGLVGIGTAGAGFVLTAPPPADGNRPERSAPLRRIEWALPVALLVALFALFVAVQLAALFGGGDYVQRTAGLTYAEYARSGFGQLAAVTVLTLVVIMATARWASTETGADRAWLRALLGGLAVLTLVIVASALSRMWAYQQAYGFTVLRVLVTACELWLGVIYLVVIAAGYRLRVSWIPRAIVGTGIGALLALAALNPERFIAEQNIARFERTGEIDINYLDGLSTDVAPALARLREPLRTCGLAAMAQQLDGAGADDWRSWNASRASARELTAGVDRSAPDRCGAIEGR